MLYGRSLPPKWLRSAVQDDGMVWLHAERAWREGLGLPVDELDYAEMRIYEAYPVLSLVSGLGIAGRECRGDEGTSEFGGDAGCLL